MEVILVFLHNCSKPTCNVIAMLSVTLLGPIVSPGIKWDLILKQHVGNYIIANAQNVVNRLYWSVVRVKNGRWLCSTFSRSLVTSSLHASSFCPAILYLDSSL